MKPSAQNRISATARRTAKQPNDSNRKLISQIELLRMRVSAAEATWKEAKEQASHAKRRRKLARLLAKRAKKDAKTAKANLDELREALARAEAQSAPKHRRVMSRKIGKAKSRSPFAKKKRPSSRHRIRNSSRATRRPGPTELPVPPAEINPAQADGAATPPAPAPGEFPATP